ncbi:hypothetical protein RR46_11158 [Papilio xuthus]|uniref:Uncharacterized protein n=1 Tax=Papilio xuthus TaxID=66420 RepID=A0A194PXI5_PAPXU|nr:hypothetical protein RR46_11158 [Papilio xuthus]
MCAGCYGFSGSRIILDQKKWLWCLLVLYSGPTWSPVRCVTVRTPPKNPTTVEAQAKFFQDFFSVQLSPYKIEFGHVCEDPNNWEQRYEKKDYKNHRDMGKVRWGDKKGGYGEHYWDLNHAGHAGDHGDEAYDSPDDSSYHEDRQEPYEEPSEQVHKYDDEDGYGPEYPSKYDEPNRAKRANTKRNMKKAKGEQDRQKAQEKTKTEESTETKPVDEYDAEASEEKETYEIKTKQKSQRIEKEHKSEEPVQPREKNHVVLILSQKERNTPETGDQTPRTKEDAKHYVPYEGGAGVRQHQYPEVIRTAGPRLFLEPSTGHVVDRATGQAYVLQPLVHKPSSS